ncbi:MAG: hypothetical protein Q4F85_00915 [Prevotella sp.]|nr:hypothetical protein [Prevotella sp.]
MVTMLACSEHHERTAALEHAIAAMRNNPDSALLILDSLKVHEQQFGRHFRMQCNLHRTNALNKLDTLFRTTDDIQQLVDYFDNHGTPNEKMLAHYLLGRAYYDTGESPMALKCFQDAVAMADTTAKDCDYWQLSRVYGQISNIFYHQNLWKDDFASTEQEIKYAWRSKDTLSALLGISGKIRIYERLLAVDSAIHVCEHVSELFNKYGYKKHSAAVRASIIRNLIDNGNLAKAKYNMDIYESESGFFNADGDIEPGREVYYYFKGQYYLAINQYDSAEYYFRKELRDGKDFNNQNAASRGLALLFQQTNRPDSAAKYALYSYEMNDSLYVQKATEEVANIHGLYNYIHNQEIAQKEKEKASFVTICLWICVIAFIAIVVMFIHRMKKIERIKRDNEAKYQKSVERLANMQIEIAQMRSNEITHKDIIAKMESQVTKMNMEICEYRNKKASDRQTAKEQLMNSDDYKALDSLVAKGTALSDDDMAKVYQLVIRYFPTTYKYIYSKRFVLTKNEFYVCILVCLYIKPNSICHLLNISSSYVSKMRSDMLKQLFGTVGKPKEFDEKIHNME